MVAIVFWKMQLLFIVVPLPQNCPAGVHITCFCFFWLFYGSVFCGRALRLINSCQIITSRCIPASMNREQHCCIAVCFPCQHIILPPWGHDLKIAPQNVIWVGGNSFCFLDHIFFPEGAEDLKMDSSNFGANSSDVIQTFLFLHG